MAQLWIHGSIFQTYSTKTKGGRISSRSVSGKGNIPAEGHQAYISTDELIMNHAQKLKDVTQLLKAQGEDQSKTLAFVDATQRLAIDHLFQEEIQDELSTLHTRTGHILSQSQDLHQISLYFRLMRQEGYHVPTDMFLHFKEEGGQFGRREKREDIEGLKALYEASQLSVKGEDILDEAALFSRQLLNQWITQLDQNCARIVSNSLRHPYHKSLPRVQAYNFSNGLKGLNDWEKPLKELSDMEFFAAQGTYRQELLRVSKWWKNAGLAKELKDARNQPLKWYLWPMAMLPSLCLSDERIDLTKCISLIYLIDDVFDIYGKPDELTLFTEAVNKWDLSAADQLPDYMKNCFKVLHDTTNEIGENIRKKYGFSNPVGYLGRTWARLCNAFLVEGRWFASQDLPEADVYLKNAIISSGVELVLVHLFFLLGLGAREDCSTCLEDVSVIVSSVATLFRLQDDLGSAKDENQNGYDGSYVECYMNEHKDVSIKIAREHVFKLIADEWKQINKECLGPSRFATPFKRAALNLARMVPLMYDYDSNHRLPLLEEYIRSMLYMPLDSKIDWTLNTEPCSF